MTSINQSKSMLKKYRDLTSVNRGDPCEEFPGVWIIYTNGKYKKEFATFDQAFSIAWQRADLSSDPDVKVSIAWKASEGDPRIKESWFTSFYQHGYFDCYLKYKV